MFSIVINSHCSSLEGNRENTWLAMTRPVALAWQQTFSFRKKISPAPRKIESVLPRICGQMLKRKSRPTLLPQNNTTQVFPK